jgi:hypothetical protein
VEAIKNSPIKTISLWGLLVPNEAKNRLFPAAGQRQILAGNRSNLTGYGRRDFFFGKLG